MAKEMMNFFYAFYQITNKFSRKNKNEIPLKPTSIKL